MKLEYIATNENGKQIKFWAYGEFTANKYNLLDARNWIINHLDLSGNWNYKPTGNWKHANND